MSRRCMVTGKGVMSGNNVSHALNRTRRKFLPNIQDTKVYSEALGRRIKLRVSIHGLRTLDHNGGFDAWLMSRSVSKLDPSLRSIRKELEKKLEAKTAAK